MELAVNRYRAADIPNCLEKFSAFGFPAIRRNAVLFGVFISITGCLNELICLSAFDNYADRDRSHERLRHDPQWLEFVEHTQKALLEQSLTLLNPSPVSPLRSMKHVEDNLALASNVPGGMLFELRTYTCHPGKLPRAMQMLGEEGNPLTHQFVERPVAYFTAETGVCNQILMLWGYRDAQERAQRKSHMLPDLRFRELGARFNFNFLRQESVFWRPLPYSPLR